MTYERAPVDLTCQPIAIVLILAIIVINKYHCLFHKNELPFFSMLFFVNDKRNVSKRQIT